MAKSAKPIGAKLVDGLKPEPDRDVFLWDSQIPGFGVRVKPSGTKAFILQYRNKFGQRRRLAIGRAGKGGLPPAKAREIAIKLKARIAEGGDPASDKAADRTALTVAQLCDQWLEAGRGHKKVSTLALDHSRIECHVKPLIGSRVVATLAHKDIEKFVRDVTEGTSGGTRDAKGGPGAALRSFNMLKGILSRAVRDGVLDKNPAQGVKVSKPVSRKLPFSFEAVAAVGRAMRELRAEGGNETGLRAAKLLLLTGLRRTEAVTLKWGLVDDAARCVRLPDTKTGPQVRPLGRAAISYLASFRPVGARPDEFVFPGVSKAGHFTSLPATWGNVTKRAGVAGVPIHGMRHWFASAAAELNYSELTIAGLLGHRIASVTARYATAPDSALVAAADRISTRLADALDGKEPGATVVSIGAA